MIFKSLILRKRATTLLVKNSRAFSKQYKDGMRWDPYEFDEDAAYEKHLKSLELWRKLSIAATIITGIVCSYNFYTIKFGEHHHYERRDFEHLRIRRKPYPWSCPDCNLLDYDCWAACKEAKKQLE